MLLHETKKKLKSWQGKVLAFDEKIKSFREKYGGEVTLQQDEDVLDTWFR